MKICDSYDALRALGTRFERERWRAYAAGIAAELPGKLERDSAGYDFQTQVLPVLNAALAAPERLARAHESFLAACAGLEERFRAALGSAPDAAVVFYLGLCNGAGWATELCGAPAVLLGAEKVLELGWEEPAAMQALVWHELAHLWHFSFQPRPLPPGGDPVWQLWSEGVAMYAEQRLLGARVYHQGGPAWLRWCNERRARLMADYRRRVKAGASVQDYFGDWCAVEGHSDVGYYLGCELARQAARGKTPAQLARMTRAEAAAALAATEGEDAWSDQSEFPQKLSF